MTISYNATSKEEADAMIATYGKKVDFTDFGSLEQIVDDINIRS